MTDDGFWNSLVSCCSSRRDTDRQNLIITPRGIGGHPGHIRFGNNVVYKLIFDERGKRECAFLNAAQNDPFLSEVVPEYLGQENLDGQTWIVMENICAGFQRPAMMDLKMGTQTWASYASVEKKERQAAKADNTTTSMLGLRVTAGCIRPFYSAPLVEIGHKKNQEICDEEKFQQCMNKYLLNKNLRDQLQLEIDHFTKWFQKQTSYQFRGTSLLLAYDADVPEPNELRVALIDFAHVEREPNTSDDGFLKGLETLNRALKSWQQPEEKLAKSFPSVSAPTNGSVLRGTGNYYDR